MNVSVGPATIVGYILTALGAITAGLASVEGNPQTAKWLAILAVVSGVLTNLGRQLQAGKSIEAAVQDVLDPTLGISHADVTPGDLVPPDGVDHEGLPQAQL